MATVTETSESGHLYLHASRGKGRLVETSRPWMSLYGTRIRAVFPVGSTSGQPSVESSLLHRMIPDDLLQEIFHHLKPYTLGLSACVCRKWRYCAMTPSLWETACMRAWAMDGKEDVWERVGGGYGGSWRRMWKERPRIRTDGIYVSRNTHIRVGIVEWNVKNPVHQVCYFRYLRFLPSGKFYYKVSSQYLKEVSKTMVGRPASSRPDDHVQTGRYTLKDNIVESAILYPGAKPTVLRIRTRYPVRTTFNCDISLSLSLTRLRGTCPGANNRMDILSLITSGMDETEVPPDKEDVLEAVEGWGDEESHHPDVPAVVHKRGMATFVFVSFENVDTDILNLSMEKMDLYFPG